MNAVSRPATSTALAVSNDEAIRVLQNSLYPGARSESVALALAWCRATGRDPMKKPIHIVPMWVKDAATGQGGMRDVLMPGIGTYRTDAARTGLYAGKSEPEFGPDVTATLDGVSVTYPKWCKVTVHKTVGSEVRPFTAMEFWTENYATAKKDSEAPNAMWRKRPYGQLAKCAESQALRMAFPDETGNTNTAEEMEGKGFDGVTIDAAPQPVQKQPAPDDDLWQVVSRDGTIKLLADEQAWLAEWSLRIGAVERAKHPPERRARTLQAMLAVNGEALAVIREAGHEAAVETCAGHVIAAKARMDAEAADAAAKAAAEAQAQDDGDDAGDAGEPAADKDAFPGDAPMPEDA